MSGMMTTKDLRHASSRLLVMAGALTIGWIPTAVAQPQPTSQHGNTATLFENVRIFDGRNAAFHAAT